REHSKEAIVVMKCDKCGEAVKKPAKHHCRAQQGGDRCDEVRQVRRGRQEASQAPLYVSCAREGAVPARIRPCQGRCARVVAASTDEVSPLRVPIECRPWTSETHGDLSRLPSCSLQLLRFLQSLSLSPL
ncbi:hypothetical protein PFISCL1PPCAC_29148, partial [Pristionchus fissidentatus]